METVQANLYLDATGNLVAVDKWGNRYRPAEDMAGLGAIFPKLNNFTPPKPDLTRIQPVETKKVPGKFTVFLNRIFTKAKGAFVKEDGSPTALSSQLVQLINRKPINIPVATTPAQAAATTTRVAPAGGGGVRVGNMQIPTWAVAVLGFVLVGGGIYLFTNSD